MTTQESDRELLELAAKAAGIDAGWLDQSAIDQDAAAVGLWLKGARGADNSQYWNPLTDDGDALRLAVKLGVDLSLYAEKGGRVYAQTKHVLGFGRDGEPSYQAHGYMDEPYGSDPFAATRRAIVRAAAQLAKGAEK